MSIPYGGVDLAIEPPPGMNAARMIREGRAEWVMLGVDWAGPGVLLLASRSLTHAELDFRAREYNYRDWSSFMRLFSEDMELTLTVHLHEIVMVAGPTYAECLAGLLRTWDPDIGQKAIGGRSND